MKKRIRPLRRYIIERLVNGAAVITRCMMNRMRFRFDTMKYRRHEHIIKRTDICIIPSEWLAKNVMKGLLSTFFAEPKMLNAVREKARSMLRRNALMIAIGKISFGIHRIGSLCDPMSDGRGRGFVLRNSKYMQIEGKKSSCASDGFFRLVPFTIRLFYAQYIRTRKGKLLGAS